MTYKSYKNSNGYASQALDALADIYLISAKRNLTNMPEVEGMKKSMPLSIIRRKNINAQIERLKDCKYLFDLEGSEENFYLFTKQLNAIMFLVNMYTNIERTQEIKKLKQKISA